MRVSLRVVRRAVGGLSRQVCVGIRKKLVVGLVDRDAAGVEQFECHVGDAPSDEHGQGVQLRALAW
jgi:hypothetical protein